MHQAGFFDELGRENVAPNLESALQRAQTLLQEKIERP
jgi:hypothetical protein